VRKQSDASDGTGSPSSAPSLTASSASSLLKAAHGRKSRARSTGGGAVRGSASIPTQPAVQGEQTPGESSADSAAAASLTPVYHKDGVYTPDEVAQHNTIDDCWLIADGVVYDVTSFLKEHPAGVAAIMRHAGKESSEDFDFHSRNAQQLWREYKVGIMKGHKQGCVIM